VDVQSRGEASQRRSGGASARVLQEQRLEGPNDVGNGPGGTDDRNWTCRDRAGGSGGMTVPGGGAEIVPGGGL